MLVLALLLGPVVHDRLRPRERILGLAAFLFLFGGAWATGSRHTQRSLPLDLVGKLLEAPRRLFAIPGALGTSSLDEVHSVTLAAIRRDYSLPPLEGPIDVYPTGAPIACAYGLAWTPRPALESYCAGCSAELERLDAEHLRGSDAPKTVLFDVRTIDDRFPSLDDGASWPELLTRYDLAAVTSQFLVLGPPRRTRTYELVPLTRATTAPGDVVHVPDHVPVWVEIDMAPTIAHRALAAAFKAPTVFLTVMRRDGSRREYRLIPDAARAGFLLSPVVDDRRRFALLAAGAWSDLEAARVESFSITSLGANVLYAPVIGVRFFKLVFEPQVVSPKLIEAARSER